MIAVAEHNTVDNCDINKRFRFNTKATPTIHSPPSSHRQFICRTTMLLHYHDIGLCLLALLVVTVNSIGPNRIVTAPLSAIYCPVVQISSSSDADTNKDVCLMATEPVEMTIPLSEWLVVVVDMTALTWEHSDNVKLVFFASICFLEPRITL